MPLHTNDKSPYVVLIIGANGAGKTTTCGKLKFLRQWEKRNVSFWGFLEQQLRISLTLG